MEAPEQQAEDGDLRGGELERIGFEHQRHADIGLADIGAQAGGEDGEGKPTATWLARRLIARTAKPRARPAPASMATMMASSRWPVDIMVTKPVTAPTTMVPSTPMLRTPERSVTSSPRAA